jgi:hypothetical protein
MATKTFNFSWMGQYRNNSHYGNGSPIRVGSTYNYHSFCGFPTTVRDALKTSKTTPKIKIKLYITDATPEWDFGGHKETTNNEYQGSMPWYDYLGNFQNSPYNGTGWVTFDITSKDNFMTRYRDGELHGIVLYSGASSTYYGEASNSGSTKAQIIVEGDWNSPPNPPDITYPTGGEIVDTSITLKWKSGGDPDGDSLKYQIAWKEGNGSGWYYLTTAYGVTEYTFDTSSWAEGSSAQFAVRASDGQEWSAYDYSNKFTIDHNQPPSKPTQLSPENGKIVDRTEVITFSWKHNDDGEQAGFRMAWRTIASDGTAGDWNYIPNSTSFSNTTNQYYNMPANTLPNSTIEWTVQTKDQQGEQSEYANYVKIEAREPTNAPTILSPAHLSTISTTRVTVEWSSLDQLEYELILYDTNGLEHFRETKASSVKLKEIPVDLENNKWYEVHLRVKDSINQIWSDYTVHAFGTSFNPPMTPMIRKFETASEGVLNIFYTAGEGDLKPELLLDSTEQGVEPTVNPIYQPYSASWDTVEVLSDDSVQLLKQGQSGIEAYLTANEIPLVEGAVYTIKTTVDQQGGRVFINALDENDTSLALSATTNVLTETAIGDIETSITLPAGTAKIRVLWYTTSDYTAGGIIHSNMALTASIPDSETTSLEMFRREYTPTGTEPWIKIAEGLGMFGSFLDFTPASGIEYEYKVRAVNSTNNTSTDSRVENIRLDFFETFLQEASNLSSIILMKHANSREAEIKLDSALLKFAGRRDPVREFGESEELVITVEWEVDTYTDVKFMRDMVRRRDILLYRDGYGRRYWVTADGLNAQDKVVRGFILSITLTVTAFEEDIDKRREEEELI